MLLRPKQRDPWDPPRWERVRSVGGVAVVVLAFVLLAVVFVDVVQPFAFEVVGHVVYALGGSSLAASIVVCGLYLAAIAAAWIWWRLEQVFGLGRRTVTFGVLAAPLWLGAIAMTPPSRESDEALRMISGYVGDRISGSRLTGPSRPV